MPANLWLLLPAIVAFATAAIFAGYRLATWPTRQAERRETGEGFAALPRLLPSGLPATFDAPDHGREAMRERVASPDQSLGSFGQ